MTDSLSQKGSDMSFIDYLDGRERERAELYDIDEDPDNDRGEHIEEQDDEE